MLRLEVKCTSSSAYATDLKITLYRHLLHGVCNEHCVMNYIYFYFIDARLESTHMFDSFQSK